MPDRLTTAQLQRALEAASVPTLVLVLAHVTGDDRWLRDPYRPTPSRDLSDHDDGGLPDDVQAQLRGHALRILDGLDPADVPALPVDRVAAMLSASLGVDVDDGFSELLAEELGVLDRTVELPAVPADRDFSVAIIGAGPSGLCAALQLEHAGVPYVVLEKNEGIGGTWLENRYPGCGVDTPSHLYSYSFAPNPEWRTFFAKRDELHAYWNRLADEHDVRRHVRFGTEVTRATWDEDAAGWTLELAGGETLEATVVLSAVGLLNRPVTPDVPGLGDFAGTVAHTARWPEGLDVAGKRVAVIGTGASAMQLVPAIAGEAAHVTVFQRSPQWAVPHPNYRREVPEGVRDLMRHVPFYLGWYRLRQVWMFGDRIHPMLQRDPEWEPADRSINRANERLRQMLTAHVEHQLRDHPELIAPSVPDYPPYGKRPLIDNGWYRTIRRDDVTLVPGAVARVTSEGVVDAGGDLHAADVLVLATGFDALRVLGPLEVVGRSGTRLRETWGPDDARAHLGVAVLDCPNLFCLYGPNTNTGHGGSVITGTEFQVRYVLELLALMLRDDVERVEVREDVHDAYNAELDTALEQTIWTHPGMTTYYRNGRGRIVTNSPWRYVDYWRRTRHVDPADYHLTTRHAVG